jgi:hypothetical protein
MIFRHTCGEEVEVKSKVFEYATLTDVIDGDPVAGDVTESVVEESWLYCDQCGRTISSDEITVEDEDEDAQIGTD